MPKINKGIEPVCKADFEALKEEQREEHRIINTKLDPLAPLGDLVPEIQSLVDDRKAQQKMAGWLLRAVTIMGTVVGIIYAFYKMFIDLR